jgi:hypothetical protein
MSRYAIVIIDKLGYAALPARTKRLFDADKPKLERDPYNPAGCRSRQLKNDRNFRIADLADGEVIIQYRIIEQTVQVRVVNIRPL